MLRWPFCLPPECLGSTWSGSKPDQSAVALKAMVGLRGEGKGAFPLDAILGTGWSLEDGLKGGTTGLFLLTRSRKQAGEEWCLLSPRTRRKSGLHRAAPTLGQALFRSNSKGPLTLTRTRFMTCAWVAHDASKPGSWVS